MTKPHTVRRGGGRGGWIFLFLLPSLIIFLAFYLVPILTVFATSLTRWDGFNSPEFIGFANYARMFGDSTFLTALRNLAAWALIATTLHVGFGVLVAFVLYHRPFGWKLTRNVFMIPNVISMAAWALIYKFIFNNDIGILNNLIRKIFPEFQVQWYYTSPYAFWAVTFTWLFFAVIVTLIVLNDLYAIPEEINEAARIDGATSWQITRRIHLPMCRNAIGTGIICSVTSRIAMYESISLTTAGGPGDDTMNLPIILVRSMLDLNYGYANANGVVMFVIGLLILWIVNRAFRMNDPVM
ncbi:MAG: sugar ABC transporter permease [Clostridia bacterium]|nr:sugar ABC transporter permease [Clostridia bacterium]